MLIIAFDELIQTYVIRQRETGQKAQQQLTQSWKGGRPIRGCWRSKPITRDTCTASGNCWSLSSNYSITTVQLNCVRYGSLLVRSLTGDTESELQGIIAIPTCHRCPAFMSIEATAADVGRQHPLKMLRVLYRCNPKRNGPVVRWDGWIDMADKLCEQLRRNLGNVRHLIRISATTGRIKNRVSRYLVSLN